MNNKITAILLCLILILSAAPVYAAAQTSEISITYFEDGSYMVEQFKPSYSNISFLSSTVTKACTQTYYSASHEKLFSITVTGTFTYGNGSAVCISSSVSTQCYNSHWSVTSSSATKSGATATATANFRQTTMGIIIQNRTATVTLTCSPSGTFS